MLGFKRVDNWSDKFRTLPPDVMRCRVERYTERHIKLHGEAGVVRDANELILKAAGRKNVSLGDLMGFVERYGPCSKSPAWDYLLMYEMIPRWQVPRAMVVHVQLMKQGR
jgi:hypothetical protein